VVIAEVAKRIWRLEKADRLAVLVAPVLLCSTGLGTFVFVLSEISGNQQIVRLRGRRMARALAEELKFIVSSSRDEGISHPFEEDAIQASGSNLRNYSSGGKQNS